MQSAVCGAFSQTAAFVLLFQHYIPVINVKNVSSSFCSFTVVFKSLLFYRLTSKSLMCSYLQTRAMNCEIILSTIKLLK